MALNRQRRILFGGVAALLLLPVLFYTIDNVRSNGEVARNVSAAGIELGGLGEDDALAELTEYEAQLAQAPAFFTVSDNEFVLIPMEIDLDIDEEAVLAEAMAVRRDSGFVGGFFSWFGSFGDQVEIDVPVTIDSELLDEVLEEWETEAIARPAYEGGIIVRDTRILPDYPRPGEGIDRENAQRVILGTVQTIDRDPADLNTRQIQPVLTNADIDAAAIEATKLIDAPVTLSATDPEFTITFTEEELARSLLTEVRTQSEPEVVLTFDPIQIEEILAPFRSDIEQPARDAAFVIDEGSKSVTLLAGRPATLLNAALVAGTLRDVAAGPANGGQFPFGEGAAPEFTTAEAEAMGEIGFVSEFTTSHPAGQQRVTNIHLMADTVDGAVVMPGEEFSINEHVGQRTAEKGYLAAPMILAGELVDDIGGGVSQFATTFYNAVFYGCYQDVTHKPHSYYFSRYPEVNEATISWPTPNLIFRNNTDTVAIIKTQYTDTSITVQFYGNNGGCKAERQLGSRFAFTDPPEEYAANPDLTPLDEKVTQNGWSGFSNTVKRVMTWPDGTVVEEDYLWVYRPAPKIREVHPCNLPPADGTECPVQVPSVIGGSLDGALGALEVAGLTFIEGPTVEISEESQNGLVVSQSPSSGEWVDLGTAVTVNIGVYVPPEEPPPDEG